MCQPKPISLADYSLATGERSFITTLRGSIRNQRRWGNSGLVHTWLHSFISHTLVFPFTNAVQPFPQRVSGATGSIVNIFTASKKEHRPIIFHVGLQRYIWTETGGIQKAFVFFSASLIAEHFSVEKFVLCRSFCHPRSTPGVHLHLNPKNVQLFMQSLHTGV